MQQLTPRPVIAAADQFSAAHAGAVAAYRDVVRTPGDRQAQVDYGLALAAVARWYTNQRQAHECIAADVAAADRYALHVWLEHSGAEDACRCGA